MELIVKSKNFRNADGFLFGLKDFSTENNLVTLDELKDMECSKIFISVDKNMFNEDLDVLENSLITLSKFGVRGVLFYDLAVLSIVKRLDLDLNLIWNQNFLVTNYKTCNHYEKEGVWGAVCSSEITLDEIITIANNTKLNLFVNAFGYQMMGLSKRHLLSSYFDYIKEDNSNSLNYIKEKDISYPILEKEYGTKILSSDVLCSIRYVDKLNSAGIKYLILDDNLIDEDVFAKVYDIFERALLCSSEELLSLEREINSIVPTSLGFFDKKTIYKVKSV